MLLVRLDPSKPTISMLSIPRELQVTFTSPYGEVITNRINSAYTYGYEEPCCSTGRAIKLMLETIKKVTGLSVNHVFIVNFKKFEHAIEEIGCLYFPVDRRYYHNNQEPGAEQYFEINLKAGYQTLCGQEALQFVANRHESTSVVRDARDQRFVLEAKKEFGGKLFEERERFEHILSKNVQSTLRGEEEIVELLQLLVESASKPVRQVIFKATLGDLDTATPEQIHEAVTQFLGGTRAISKRKLNGAVSAAKKKGRKKGLEPSMVPTSAEALDHARAQAPNLPFALEYPRIRNSTSQAEPDELRLYKLHGPHHHPYRSYVIVISRGLLGQYYDVQGTTWLTPPILNDPSQEVKIGSRLYCLYYSGEHITTIAWREANAVYWIENTLTNDVSPREMIEIAEETQPVDRVVSRSPLKRAKAAQAALAIPSASSTQKSRNQEIATILGAVSLIALLALLLLVLLRHRELRSLRRQMGETAIAIDEQTRKLAGMRR
jgi:LCP family protein required for cell wall assembly